jgi:DNA repair protein RadD
MPGGSGKSVVIAEIVRQAVSNWKGTRVLMLVHSKELIAQNAEKLRAIWPEVPLGVVSASLGVKDYGRQITYAGIASVYRAAEKLGRIDLMVIDEVHMVNHKDEGMYRKLINALFQFNPNMRIIGLSASPFRLGHGLITDGKDAIFSDILEPTSIIELVNRGYLMPLRSKVTEHTLSTEGLHTRGGEFVAGEMAARFNTDSHNAAVVQEIIKHGQDYRHWLIFCAGVDHSEAVAALFNQFGVPARSLTSGDDERDQILADFREGRIRALCNVGILTTGYDFPDLDLIAFLRATKSPGLYLQMAVRGMRIKSHTDHCRVLDFAEVVRTHGPVTAVTMPTRESDRPKSGVPPIRICDNCSEICHSSERTCPACGAEFPKIEKKSVLARPDDADIMSKTMTMRVSEWRWREYVSKSGNPVLKLTYYGDLSDPPVHEYFAVNSENRFAKNKALSVLSKIRQQCGAGPMTLDAFNAAMPPESIEYLKDGSFYRVLDRVWPERAIKKAPLLGL